MRILDNIGLVQDPIHLGAVILEKLIDDLKSKLPFLAKKKGADDDLDEEEELGDTETETEVSSEDDEKTSIGRVPKRDDDTSVDEEMPDNSLVGKLKAKLSALQKKKPQDDLEAALADEGDVPVKEKKKPNFIVILGALGLMAFIFLSDFGDEEAPVADPAAMLKKRPKKVKPTTETPPAETTPTDGTATSPTDTPPTDTPVTTPSETSPTETPPAETTPTDGTATTTEPTITEPATSETPVDTTVTTPTDATSTDTTTPVDTTITTAPEDTTTTPSESSPTETTPTDTTTTAPVDNESPDSINGEETKVSDDNLTEQILKDLENQAQGTEKAKPAVKTEYVAPPNYENVGRGLVYNCGGKHWACIDGPSYKMCEDNASSNKYLGKKSECYPFNVYETQSGCEKTQNRMVSSSAKTEFCGE